MNIKNDFSVIDIIGISLIFIVLAILIIPLFLKISENYQESSTKIKATTLINAAFTEYTNDTNLGRTITAYCYRNDYGYPKTLNDGTIKSINNLKEDVSYYMTFDENGNLISFVYADDKYGIDIRKNVNQEAIENLENKDLITKEKAFEIIEKCPYNSN